jgi:hypothetical protein
MRKSALPHRQLEDLLGEPAAASAETAQASAIRTTGGFRWRSLKGLVPVAPDRPKLLTKD